MVIKSKNIELQDFKFEEKKIILKSEMNPNLLHKKF